MNVKQPRDIMETKCLTQKPIDALKTKQPFVIRKLLAYIRVAGQIINVGPNPLKLKKNFKKLLIRIPKYSRFLLTLT